MGNAVTHLHRPYLGYGAMIASTKCPDASEKMGGPVSRVSGVHIIGGQELAVFLKLSKTSVLFFALS